MDCLEQVLARLAAPDACGYHQGSICSTEPASLAALALLAHGRERESLPLVQWLLSQQSANGSVGIGDQQSTPAWATGWATIAWNASQASCPAETTLPSAIDRAVRWMVASRGAVMANSNTIGHDATIEGWPWVEGTHAWVEPTAINLLALKHVGLGGHPRARDAAKLLQNRLLARGGCNYGNTFVLGQELLPHLQPTGLALLALGGEPDTTGKIAESIAYLNRELSPRTATASLCFGLLGLAAQRSLPDWADEGLETAARRTLARDPAGYKLALLALAAQKDRSPLLAGHPSHVTETRTP